jgi:catechol 2,3-dioxygenase
MPTVGVLSVIRPNGAPFSTHEPLLAARGPCTEDGLERQPRRDTSEGGGMGIIRLGHVGLVVPDVDRYAEFLVQALGARVVARDDTTAHLALNSRHHQIRLRQGAAAGCDGVGFDVTDADALARLRRQVDAAGLEITSDDPVDGAVAKGFSVQVPDGPTVELCVGVATAPSAVGGIDPYRIAHGSIPRIKKLGHVTVGTPDPEGVEKAFVDVLGFRISDRFPGVLAWARCNSDHHSVGFAPAEAPGVHHVAYEIESFAHYELFADRLASLGTRLVWGPGRHGPGNNLFAYFEDPAGNLIEIYSDMIRIENEHDYVPLDWTDLQEVGNRWGPMPDDAWFKMLTPFVSTVVA